MSHNTTFDYIYIFATILLTVYGQLVVKWQVAKAGALPNLLSERALFLLHLVLNPWIISGVGAGFFALLCWLVAMTKFELSYAYPFMSLAFVLVFFLSALLFHEAMTAPKALGVALVVTGIIIASRG
jgi:multidrug transporter EmrE-like cation transporter